MSASPTFFIVPGFMQLPSEKGFSWLEESLKKKGFKVYLVPIKWKYRVMSDYIRQFKHFYLKHKSQNNFVLGFSYGAVITFATASELNPDKIFLCSLSPDFKEDQVKMKSWMKEYIGKKRLDDSSSRSARVIAKNLKVPSVVFYGEKEARQYPELKVRCEETVNLAHNSKLIIVPNSPHQIDHPEYIKAIEKELQTI